MSAVRACPLIVVVILSVTGVSRADPAATQPVAIDAHIKLAVDASNDLAFDMYAQLAGSREHAGGNLFFSSYSISVALTMAAEGARGETAEQMGRALHFPPGLRRQGANASANPWDLQPLHMGFQSLAERLNGYSDRPQVRAMQQKIAALRKELTAADDETRKIFDSGGDLDKSMAAREKAQGFADQLNQLLPLVDPYELRVANALWIEQVYPFRQSYLDTINRFYGRDRAFSLDFRHDPEGARRQINAWIDRQTDGRIHDLVPPEMAGGPLGVALTNAVYFKGEWLEPFEADQTKEEDFAAAGVKIRVAMMQLQFMKFAKYAAFNADGSYFATPAMIPARPDPNNPPALYPSGGGMAMVELPYKGDGVCMLVISPVDETGLQGLEKKLTAKTFDQWAAHLVNRKVHVFLPKFKVETRCEMSAMLKTMGMERAFNDPMHPDGAQFDGMCAFDNLPDKPYITDVLHKACVEVNERGTEAATVTTVFGPVFGAGGGVRRMKPFTPTFRADRPFVFAIRDSRTGLILFLGRVSNPIQDQAGKS